MNKTANFDLPQWEKSDFIQMDDFNAAFGTLDGALKRRPTPSRARRAGRTSPPCGRRSSKRARPTAL